MTKSSRSTQTPLNRVVAIDPGFDRLGVAVLEKEGSKEKLLYSCCITTNPKENRDQRLLDVGIGLGKIIDEWTPDALAVETLFFNKNISSAIGVAEARGVVIYEAKRKNLKVFEYSPQAIKIAVTGYGKATKSQIETMVERLIDLPTITKKLDDEIDAIALGITHLASVKPI